MSENTSNDIQRCLPLFLGVGQQCSRKKIGQKAIAPPYGVECNQKMLKFMNPSIQPASQPFKFNKQGTVIIQTFFILLSKHLQT